jgi:putative transposase
MQLEEGHVFHIYNQGNNRQRIFFEEENYHFFIKKMQVHLLPYCNILAYCLMPNHFHWMVEVLRLVVDTGAGAPAATHGVTQSHPVSSASSTNLNNSIGILLRSYTRAINKRFGYSGSLFRGDTKAICLTKNDELSPAFFDTQYGALINVSSLEMAYPQVCFNYIHYNPVKSRLVIRPEDWEFSSYLDYKGKREGSFVNSERKRILFGK